MSLAVSLLTNDPDNADSLTYTTSAVTPSGSCGILVVAGYTTNTTLAPPTLDVPTWLDGAWAQEADASSGTLALTVFSGKAIASPSSDDLTATFDVTQAGCNLSIVQVTGQDPTTFTRQATPDSGAAATSASVTLPGALLASTSLIFGAIGIAVNSAISPTNGETVVYDTGHNAPARRTEAQFKLNDTTTSWSFASSIHRAVALELIEASGAAALAPWLTTL